MAIVRFIVIPVVCVWMLIFAGITNVVKNPLENGPLLPIGLAPSIIPTLQMVSKSMTKVKEIKLIQIKLIPPW